ncbi:WecE Predicted pyridoxal phosphate-dependent enzyme apparently involved in regulation of cell wall biogenesis [Candidatus Nanopelagicaceae bacterium]
MKVNLSAPNIGDSEIEAVTRVLRSGNLAQGREVENFENEFSSYMSGYHCIAVNSGTSALHLSLLAIGIGPGDEVIVPSFSFAASANSIAITGATPIFVDIDPETFCLDVMSVEAAITSKTVGILPVHLYGNPAPLQELSRLCAKYGLFLLEDAAQAHFAAIDGKPVGTFGQGGCFSFYPTKNMTSGEGGMVVTSDEAIAARVRLLRNQGMKTRYQNEIVGLNNRMTDIHAAIGRVQLNRLSEFTAKRIANAEFLNKNLVGVVTPQVRSGYTHVFHQYTILTLGMARSDFQASLQAKGVACEVYYPTPIHQLPSFNQQIELPVTKLISENCLSIPVHPSLSKENLEFLVESVNDTAKDLSK